MLTKPTSTRTAETRDERAGSSMARLSAISPRYIRNSTKTDVSRASQTHQAPHIGLPQSEPVTSARKVKQAPIGAAARDDTSASGCRQTSVPRAASAITE
ncbi:hypothetical protein D3C72_2164310 [compost metagenome]